MPPRAALIGIDVADDVGDRDVGRRQLLDVPRLARQPRDRQRVALLLDPRPARAADRARADRR